jgi:hypothetical protein
VIVNVSQYGCHALIVDFASGQPRIVNLPGLSVDAAAANADQMLRALAAAANPARSSQERDSDHVILGILNWLWDAVAEPVLTALGYTSPPRDGIQRPRVWWCPTGPLTLLPLHAAGRYPRELDIVSAGSYCVPGRIISSYTPTLTALIRARQPARPAGARHLTIGMPDTPGLPPLPAVTNEMKILARYFPGRDNPQLTGRQATRTAVMAAAAACSWIHLACHAIRQDADPDRSGFALRDGTLTIADLAVQPSRRRDLAFLSACQTATGSTRHPDEALHLAAAMQFLGYRHVIATMWTTIDSHAPRIADSVYHMLTSNGPDPRRAAEALDEAIRVLRQRGLPPRIWAPYIHLGP